MAQKQPSARFTEDHKVVLKDIILGDPELKAHIVHQSISSKERQTELWRILVDKFNELTGQKYVKEQISNFLSRIKRNELTERQRRLDEGVTTEPADFWLTSSNPQDLVRASPASFSQVFILSLSRVLNSEDIHLFFFILISLLITLGIIMFDKLINLNCKLSRKFCLCFETDFEFQ